MCSCVSVRARLHVCLLTSIVPSGRPEVIPRAVLAVRASPVWIVCCLLSVVGERKDERLQRSKERQKGTRGKKGKMMRRE